MNEVSTPAAPAPRILPIDRPPTRRWPTLGGMFLFGGVILPVVTLMFEFWAHWSAQTFFDPIPTWWHALLVALVPLANLGVYLAARRGGSANPRALGHLNAVAIGISFVYALVFLPLIHIWVMGIAFIGLGLLPLAPLLSCLAAMRARRVLRQVNEDSLPPIWIGLLAAVGLLLAPSIPEGVTHYGLNLALRADEHEQARGISLLRHFGSRDHLLKACYGQVNQWPPSPAQVWPVDAASRFFSGPKFVPRDEVPRVQQIFYRVFGEAHNEFPAPSLLSVGGRGRGMWNVDENLGGTQVANKVAGLSMNTSQMEGRVETAGSTSYFEWTMVFKNIAANASEARAQIELPPGAVVSRLTLWINGEPREAAFGGRDQVRKAYQQIAVQQRRDPVLVTTSGPDRVLMQCFPVPANGGEMKVRLGITAPLRMLDEREGRAILPRFSETNFEQAWGFRHGVKVTGDQPLSADGKNWRDEAVMELTDEKLRDRPAVQTQRAVSGDAWTDDPTDPAMIIRQTVRRATVPAPRRIVFVIDGSKRAGAATTEIANALQGLPAAQNFTIYFAGDEVEALPAHAGLPAAGRWLAERRVIGGRDNLPALVRAWDDAAATPGSALVWIHAPQPVLLASLDPLLDRFAKSSGEGAPVFYDLAVVPGLNRLLENTAGIRQVKAINFGGSAMADLRHLMALWSGRETEFVAERTRLPRAEPLAENAKGDRHIARLWGLEEIERLRAASEPESIDQAIKLALELQLVTPVSGAVVLETKEQYDRHGLQPVDPATTPVVPEPATAILFVVGVLLWFAHRRPRTVPAQRS